MPRLTVTISDEHEEILQQKSDVGEAYRSQSEVIRECIESFERVEELSEQLACLEAEVEMLRDQRAQLKQKAARVDELEGKLRQLQAAYHQAIDEGHSPQELESVETDIETEPSATALIEEAESSADSPKPVESTSPDTAQTASATSSTSDEPPKTRQTATASGAQTQTTASRTQKPSTTSNSQTPTTSNTQQTASPPADPSPEQSTPAPSARGESARPAEGRRATQQTGNPESATDGGVEIDEELLYQSPSVGSRIKSALFGGPGGSR